MEHRKMIEQTLINLTAKADAELIAAMSDAELIAALNEVIEGM